MKRFSLIFLFVFLFMIAFSQYKTPHIVFSKTTHNFGKLKEGISASVKFEFTNTGAEPLVIQNVTSSCGCTVPSWSKKPIPPGGKGFINVVYNTTNRPGSFRKSITVYSNADNSPTVLYITGEVEKPKEDNQFRYTIANKLKINKNFLNFGTIYNNEKQTLEIQMFNPTNEKLKIIAEDRYKPHYVDVKIEPEVLEPQQKGKIIITYDASKVNDWDYVRGYIYLTVNGQRDYRNRIQISAVVKEYFTEEQRKNPPRIEFDHKVFNFDTVKEGDIVIHEFKFKNTGKSDLYIRKTRSSCGCTAVSVNKGPIPPGGTGVIKATFNTNHKRYKQTKVITVITNCPEPQYNKVLLRLEGYVIPKQQQQKPKTQNK